jgi:LysM repeat protein
LNKGAAVSPKHEIIPTLTLRENFKMVMVAQGLTFKDLSRRSGVPVQTAYRLVAVKSPDYVTPQVLRLGNALGFTKRQILEQVERDRLLKGKTFGKKAKLYALLREIIDLFEGRGT